VTEIVDRSFADLSTQEFHDLARLRVDVFVVEQNCPYHELDGHDTDAGTRHIWIESPEPVTYLRLLEEAGSRRIGRVATRPGNRGRGLARQLLEYVIDTYPGELVLDAQSYLVEWYESFGFVSTGDQYLDEGIAHVPMHRGSSLDR